MVSCRHLYREEKEIPKGRQWRRGSFMRKPPEPLLDWVYMMKSIIRTTQLRLYKKNKECPSTNWNNTMRCYWEPHCMFKKYCFIQTDVIFPPIHYWIGHEKEIRNQIAMSCYLNSYHNCKNVQQCFLEKMPLSAFLTIRLPIFVHCQNSVHFQLQSKIIQRNLTKHCEH